MVPEAHAGRVQAVETLVHPGSMAAVVDELVLAAQLVVEDGGVVIRHVVTVPVCPVTKQTKSFWVKSASFFTLVD